MERIFGVKSDINSVIKATEQFLANLRQLQKQKVDKLNPNYVALLNKLFNSPDIMTYKR